MDEKIIDEMMGEVDKKMCLDSPKEAEIYRKILRKSIQKAKKELFYDVAKQPLYAINKGKKIKYIDVKDTDWFKELKKRHLSTFPKKEKRHNTRLKKERVLHSKK